MELHDPSNEVRILSTLTLPIAKNAIDSEVKSNSKLPYKKKLIVKCNVNESIAMDPDSLIKVFASKPPTSHVKIFDSKNTLVGFNPSNLVLDGVQTSLMGKFSDLHQPRISSPPKSRVLTSVVVGNDDYTSKGISSPNLVTETIVLDLPMAPRNYNSIMDQHALHNFIIHHGKAIRTTPEFVSFHRCYKDVWDGMNEIIRQLEDLMASQNVSLAIITGLKVHELDLLKQTSYTPAELIQTVANLDYVLPQMTGIFGAENARIRNAVVLIQTRIRMKLALLRVRRLLIRNRAAVVIQAEIRRYLCHSFVNKQLRKLRSRISEYWKATNIQLIRSFNLRVGDLYRKQSHQSAVQQTYSSFDIQSINMIDSMSIDVKGRPIKPIADADVIHHGVLIIHIATISALELVRVNLSNITALQNSHISCFHQLADPLVTLLYVCPTPITPLELNYHAKLLDMLHLPPNAIDRVRFITPEACNLMPRHMSVSALLWYSSVALIRIRQFARKFANVMIIPSAVTWAEKKLGYFLQCPMSCPDPTTAETITSKSFLKSSFMDAKVNIPVGAHDIHTDDDVLIALARLIASNLDVNRWLLRMNYDYNNESVCVMNVDKMPFIISLREEQLKIQKAHGATSQHWYGRNLQVAVRKRILKALQAFGVFPVSGNASKTTGSTLLQFCRPDIFSSWSHYSNMLHIYGGLIEAEPPGNILGHLRCIAHINPLDPMAVKSVVNNSSLPMNGIDPLQLSPAQYDQYLQQLQIQQESSVGVNNNALDVILNSMDGGKDSHTDAPCVDVKILGGLEILVDDNYQCQGVCYPQRQIPPEALYGATAALCNALYRKYNVVGYIEVNYVVFWDSFENVPKMWGLDFSFGFTYSANCVSLLNRVNYMTMEDKAMNVNKLSSGGVSGSGHGKKANLTALYPDFLAHARNPSLVSSPSWEGRCCVYLPIAVHASLQGTRDDVFYKLCAMHGITYDSDQRTGTLFFLTDTIVGSGTLSILCVSNTRQKVLEMVLNVTNFICLQFGKEHSSSTAHLYETKSTGQPVTTWDTLRGMLTKVKMLLKKPQQLQKTNSLASK